jgi:hypothetical protein
MNPQLQVTLTKEQKAALPFVDLRQISSKPRDARRPLYRPWIRMRDHARQELRRNVALNLLDHLWLDLRGPWQLTLIYRAIEGEIRRVDWGR